MKKFKHFDYEKLLMTEIMKFPLIHNLDFANIDIIDKEDVWIDNTIKQMLHYTVKDNCRCGTTFRNADPNKILTKPDYEKAQSIFMNDILELFATLFSSLEWRDLQVKHIIFPTNI